MKPATSTSKTCSPRQPATALQKLRRAVSFARRTDPCVKPQASESTALNCTDGTFLTPVSLVITPARFTRGVVGSSVQSLRTALFGQEKPDELVGGGNLREGAISNDAELSGGGGRGRRRFSFRGYREWWRGGAE